MRDARVPRQSAWAVIQMYYYQRGTQLLTLRVSNRFCTEMGLHSYLGIRCTAYVNCSRKLIYSAELDCNTINCHALHFVSAMTHTHASTYYTHPSICSHVPILPYYQLHWSFLLLISHFANTYIRPSDVYVVTPV